MVPAELIAGYRQFKKQYVEKDNGLLKKLAQGQKPYVMILACCDARVDPALLLQSKPGDLFVARSIANFVMPFSKANNVYQGVSAALEFGIRQLKVEHLIILGHSQCGGIKAFLTPQELLPDNDFISQWLNLMSVPEQARVNSEICAKATLLQSYQNCLTFPWIKARVENQTLAIHLWFFDIKTGSLETYCFAKKEFQAIAGG